MIETPRKSHDSNTVANSLCLWASKVAFGPASRRRRINFAGLAALAAVVLACFSGRASALTVTATTSDNGYPAHLVKWTDSGGLTRSAMMVDQNTTAPGPYTGYLRQYTYTYTLSGVTHTRVCTGSYSYSTGGDLEFSGDGFVQNHGVNGDDSSTGNGRGFPGLTKISPAATGTTHAVTITYTVPNYMVEDLNGNPQKVPTTVQWFFADGRNDPIFAVTQDASATPGALGLDSRSPYGDMAYDGVLPASPGATIFGTDVGGYSYGDQYKFVTLASSPEEVTPASAWIATATNSIPYAMQWTETATVNAEMGHVATVPLSVSDQGSDSQTSPYYQDPTNPDQEDYSAALYFDPRDQSYPSGPLPPWNTQAYQIINEPGGLSSDVGLNTPLAKYEPGDDSPNPPTDPQPTTEKRLAWQSNFGRLGGWNVYSEYADNVFNYSTHALDPVPTSDSYQGSPRASGEIMSYSTYVVLGLHTTGANVVGTSYKTGAVGYVVTQMQNAQLANFKAITGTILTKGPAGIPTSGVVTSANSNPQVTYQPVGYNPIYGTWDMSCYQNAAAATLTPAAGTSLDHPTFCIHGYTSSALPPAISVGNKMNTPNKDYFVTLDATYQRLWITVNRVATSAITLIVAKN
jgi:hypothetical protein